MWLVAQRTLTLQRRDRFVVESGEHPGRMAPALAAEAVRRYSRPGDLVLDPMCGIGTTLVEAVHAGRHALGIECEHRWADIARANLALASRQHATGSGGVVTGDARRLNNLRLETLRLDDIRPTHPAGPADPGDPGDPVRDLGGRVRLVLTSPPYGPSTHGRVSVPRAPGPLVSHLHETYADQPHPANLAHADLPGLRHGLTRILASCARLVSCDGVVVITARPWRHNGLLVDLPSLIVTAAEQAGLRLVDRCVALLAGDLGDRLVPRHSFHQLLQVRRARSRGDDWLLLSHEDVLVLRPAEGAHHAE